MPDTPKPKRGPYDYDLPKELIANAPTEPRDAARLLVYSTQTDEIVIDSFYNIARYLPSSAVLVLNDTKVVPARLTLKKPTGGEATILFLMNEWDGSDMIKGLPDKKIDAGEPLSLVNKPILEAVSNHNEEFTFRLLVAPDKLRDLLREYGRTPLPPYIHPTMSEDELRDRYQTTFAEHPSSVAAPTASLHLTDRVFKSLELKDIRRAKVTLHVGRGTFSPVSPEMQLSMQLHPEPIFISEDSARMIAEAKAAGRAVIACGTTALRLLEAAPSDILAGRGFRGETRLFIRPPYRFQVADALITNFHLPGTSLLMLLDAFMQHKGAKRSWRELYERAISERFRFYSFGDAMLII